MVIYRGRRKHAIKRRDFSVERVWFCKVEGIFAIILQHGFHLRNIAHIQEVSSVIALFGKTSWHTDSGLKLN